MRRTKQLLAFRKSTILNETAKTLLASRIDELIIVLGHDSNRLRNSLRIKDQRLKLASNKRYKEGISSSIKCGISSANSATDAYLIALADQPLITTETINRLIEKYLTSRAGIVTVTYRSVRGHPVIISKKYFKQLSSLMGDVGARDLLQKYKEDTATVDVDSPEIILDIDREEDYAKLRNASVAQN